MFECSYQVVAAYVLDEKDGETLRPVLAWDETGVPQVLGEKSLVPADTLPGFTGVRVAGTRSDSPRTLPTPVVIRPKPREDPVKGRDPQ
jgi:hypothetical protein